MFLKIRKSSNGILINTGSSNGIIQKTAVTDSALSGFLCKGNCLLIEDSSAQHNGIDGIKIQNGHDVQVHKNNIEANGINGIIIDAESARIQVESCRSLGNGAIGCVDEGAIQSVWLNNLSSGNTIDDYSNIRAVSIAKATSYWHNVYGN